MAHQPNSLSKSPKRYLNQTWVKQKGAALILIAFILGLGAAVYVLKTYNAEAVRNKQDEKASLILAQAKQAIIAYSISRASAGERPGDMPRPDYFASTEIPANYDGNADGGCLDVTSADGLPLINSGANMRCLGRLPWLTIGMTGLDATQNDPLGNMPWYAVSANLVDPTCLKLINPSILSMIYTTYQCNSLTNLPHPWLTVKDSLGNIISSRVAVVLLMPMRTINTQTRPELPLASIGDYLEADNSNFDNIFTLAPAGATLNDKLVFITIDELMAAISKRALSDMSILLNKYNKKNTHFPYAAPLGSSLNNFMSSGAATTGMVPVDVTDICNSTPATNCSLQPIASIAFTRVSGTAWTSNTGACTRSGATCTCTVSAGGSAIGSCSRTTRTFSCNSSGVCSHNVTGTNKYTYTVPSYANVNLPTGACTLSSQQIAVCTNTGTFSIGLVEPDWFSTNLWQDYLYYEFSPTSILKVGTKGNLSAILINTGDTDISETGWTQSRPSSDIRDYLDSATNVSNTGQFDAISKKSTSAYNDQPIIVFP
jgi:hypothetical protein